MRMNASVRRRVDEAARTVTRAYVRLANGQIWDLWETMDHGLAMQLLAERVKFHEKNHGPGCTGHFEVHRAGSASFGTWATKYDIAGRRDFQDDCGSEYNGRLGARVAPNLPYECGRAKVGRS